MIKCEKCKLEFGNNGSYVRHSKECDLNGEVINSIIEDYTKNELTVRQIRKKYGITFLRLRRLFSFYGVKMRDISTALKISNNTSKPHTEESKRKISVS